MRCTKRSIDLPPYSKFGCQGRPKSPVDPRQCGGSRNSTKQRQRTYCNPGHSRQHSIRRIFCGLPRCRQRLSSRRICSLVLSRKAAQSSRLHQSQRNCGHSWWRHNAVVGGGHPGRKLRECVLKHEGVLAVLVRCM